MSAPTLTFTPQTYNLALYAGDGAAIRITTQNPDGTPLELTGTLTAQIRHTRGDPTPQASFTVDLTDATDGVATLSLTGSQTGALLNGEDTWYGAWDLQWTPDGAEPVTLIQGAVKCGLDVTRA